MILGVGFFTGWFSFGSETRAGETELRLRVDRENVRDDLRSVEDGVRRGAGAVHDAVTGKAQSAQEPQAQEGGAAIHLDSPSSKLEARVLGVSVAESTLTLQEDAGDQRSYPVAAGSKVDLHQVRIGDLVQVTLISDGAVQRVVDLRVLSGT
ncbi:MAG: hypothetical protein R3F49_07780 [Planctomycetota bacterium]